MDLERSLKPYNPPTTTLIDCLQYWTDKTPDDLAYLFTDGEAEESSFTHALDTQIQRLSTNARFPYRSRAPRRARERTVPIPSTKLSTSNPARTPSLTIRCTVFD